MENTARQKAIERDQNEKKASSKQAVAASPLCPTWGAATGNTAKMKQAGKKQNLNVTNNCSPPTKSGWTSFI